MARPPTLTPTKPVRLLKRVDAAAYVSVSPTTFDLMVADERMPKPRQVHGTRIAWDVRELDAAVDDLPVVGEASPDTWGDLRNGHHRDA